MVSIADGCCQDEKENPNRFTPTSYFESSGSWRASRCYSGATRVFNHWAQLSCNASVPESLSCREIREWDIWSTVSESARCGRVVRRKNYRNYWCRPFEILRQYLTDCSVCQSSQWLDNYQGYDSFRRCLVSINESRVDQGHVLISFAIQNLVQDVDRKIERRNETYRVW